MPDHEQHEQTEEQRHQADIIMGDVFYGGIPSINEALTEAGLPMVLSEQDFFAIFKDCGQLDAWAENNIREQFGGLVN